MDALNDIICGLKWGDLDPVEAHDRVLALFSVRLSFEQKRQMIESAQDYQTRAYSGHFAGEEPEYHYRNGMEEMLRILKSNES